MVQLWPAADTFTNDALIPWFYPDRYLLINPANGDDTSDGVTYKPFVGALYRRLNSSGNPLNPAQAGMATTNGQTVSSVGKTSMGCTLERSVVRANVDVSAEFELEVFPEAVSTSANTDFLRGYFVWARVADGATKDGSTTFDFVSGTKFSGIEYPRGLFFGHVKSGTDPDQFVLGHLVEGSGGGVVIDHKIDVQDLPGIGTIMSTVSGGPFVEAHLNQDYGFYKPETLRIRCDGTRVRCYARVRGSEVGQLNEALIFDETTSETQAGRCGLGPQMVVRNLAGSGYAMMHSKWFQIKAAGGPVLFRDEWGRINHKAALLINPHSTNIKNGPSLMSAYTGDGFGTTLTTGTGFFPHHFHLRSDPANDSITLGRDLDVAAQTGTGHNYGFYINQQISFTDSFSEIDQRRSATFGVNTVNDWELGIALRTTFLESSPSGFNFRAEDQSGNPYDTHKQMYLAVVSSEGGNFEIRIDRYNILPGQGEVVTIARASIADPGSPSTFTLEFEARRGSIEGSAQTFASLRVTYGGVIQTLTPETSEYERVDNWINDATFEVVRSGFGTGFFYQHDSDAFEADAVSIADFTRLVPTIFDSEVDPKDQASVVLASEDASKSGELTTPLSWQIQDRPCSAHRSADFDTGFRFSNPRYSRSRHQWFVRVSGATYAEGQNVLDLFASNGASIPFDWTRADTQEAFVAKFVGGRLALQYDHQSGSYSGSFELVQVFGEEFYNE